MQILAVNQNKPSFKADIRVFTSPQYRRLPISQLGKAGKYVGFPWSVPKSSMLLEEGYTRELYVCTGGYIQNGKTGFIFHFNSVLQNIKKAKEFMRSRVESLRVPDDNNQVSAFLTGGRIQDAITDSFYGSSEELYCEIKDALTEMNVPFSAIWGQKGNFSTNLFSSAQRQVHIISPNLNNATVNQIRDINDLRAFYRDVIIAPQDKLILSSHK